MNPLTNIKNINKLNEIEADLGVSASVSWHQQYKDSAYIYIGGLPYKLTEGDILAVFSQYGEIVNINLVRDKKTGKSQGFCFIAYEDQRSTILAVDNFNGIQLLGRTIRVDHVAEYRAPKEHDDDDEETLRLRSEGCAPKVEPDAPPSLAEEDDHLRLPKKTKKEKKSKKDKDTKKKKKKKKQKERSSERSSDESSDEGRTKASDKMTSQSADRGQVQSGDKPSDRQEYRSKQTSEMDRSLDRRESRRDETFDKGASPEVHRSRDRIGRNSRESSPRRRGDGHFSRDNIRDDRHGERRDRRRGGEVDDRGRSRRARSDDEEKSLRQSQSRKRESERSRRSQSKEKRTSRGRSRSWEKEDRSRRSPSPGTRTRERSRSRDRRDDGKGRRDHKERHDQDRHGGRR